MSVSVAQGEVRGGGAGSNGFLTEIPLGSLLFLVAPLSTDLVGAAMVVSHLR